MQREAQGVGGQDDGEDKKHRDVVAQGDSQRVECLHVDLHGWFHLRVTILIYSTNTILSYHLIMSEELSL